MTGPSVSLFDEASRPLDMDGDGAIDLFDASLFTDRFLEELR